MDLCSLGGRHCIFISDDIFFCREKNAGRITAGSLFCWPIVCRLLSSFDSSARRRRHTKASGATTYTQEGGSNNDNRQRNNKYKRQTHTHTKSLLKNIQRQTRSQMNEFIRQEKKSNHQQSIFDSIIKLFCVCVSTVQLSCCKKLFLSFPFLFGGVLIVTNEEFVNQEETLDLARNYIESIMINHIFLSPVIYLLSPLIEYVSLAFS